MVKNITTKELKQKIDNKEEFILIDCRTKAEYEKGHIDGPILIPYDELKERHLELNADKGSQIIIYCRTGHRSLIGAKILESLGYTDVTNVLGGILDWIENGYKISE